VEPDKAVPPDDPDKISERDLICAPQFAQKLLFGCGGSPQVEHTKLSNFVNGITCASVVRFVCGITEEEGNDEERGEEKDEEGTNEGELNVGKVGEIEEVEPHVGVVVRFIFVVVVGVFDKGEGISILSGLRTKRKESM